MNWSFATSVATVGGAVVATIVGTVELLNYQAEQSKYSEETKYQIVKKAMLQLVPSAPLDYPKLCAKDQDDMMRRLVFSNVARLVLVEGAQGKLIQVFDKHTRLSSSYRMWQDDACETATQ